MISNRPSTLSHDAAFEIAVGALSYLAGEPEQLGRFLTLAGIGPAEIREVASQPEFLVGVLEFFMQDEQLLLAYTESASLRPTMLAAARFTLDDGNIPCD